MSLDIILEPNFKEWFKQNEQQIANKYWEYSDKYLKSKIKENNPKELLENVKNYIKMNKLGIIRFYAKNNFYDTFDFYNDYIYREDFLEYDRNKEALQEYTKYLKSVKDLVYKLFVAQVIENIYKNKDKLNNPKVNEAFKGLKGNSLKDFLTVGISYKDIKNIYCNNDILIRTLPCKNLDFPYKINQTYRKYAMKDKCETINTVSYTIFNLLYLMLGSYRKERICDVKQLINQYDKDKLFGIFRDLSIVVVPNKNPLTCSRKTCESLSYGNYIVYFNSKLREFLKKCVNQDKFIVLNCGMQSQFTGHANILIYNPNTKQVEIFEPEESDKKIEEVYQYFVQKVFPITTPKIKYVPQREYITHFFQDIQEAEETAQTDHCLTWSIWYADKRLEYPDLNAKDAFKKIYNDAKSNLSATRKIFSDLIKEYTDLVKEQRSIVIKQLKEEKQDELADLLIEEWINIKDPLK